MELNNVAPSVSNPTKHTTAATSSIAATGLREIIFVSQASAYPRHPNTPVPKKYIGMSNADILHTTSPARYIPIATM